MTKIRKLSFEEIKSTRPTLEEVKENKKYPVVVIAENIRSLYNVGSIFRTSDGAGIETLYLCGYTGYPPRKEIDKTALGSVESVKWFHKESAVNVVKDLKKQGYTIASLEHTDSSVNYMEANFKFPLCIILGNEVDGESQELVAMSDLSIEIPMYGIKQSLNVSVAYGIIIYHVVDYYNKNFV